MLYFLIKLHFHGFLEDKINGLSPFQFQEKRDRFSLVPHCPSKLNHNSWVTTVTKEKVKNN